MITLKRTAVRIGGVLGTVLLLCCVILTSGRAAGPAASQAVVKDFNPSVNCPDATLADIDHFDLGMIKALQQGISGLPCDGEPEQSGTDFTAKLQHGFDYYSWLTFIALNSPAKGGKFSGANMPTVWETYKQLPDVMLPGGARPADWTDPNPPIVPSQCASEFKAGMMIIHMEAEETYNEPFKSGALFDQNGNYALFVILMNHQMFQYIADHSLYSRKGQQDFAGEIDFPNGSDGSEKDHPEKTLGAVMIKASWKLMKDSDLVRPKYHIVDALLYRPNAPQPCRAVKLGLIGFHVGHKTVTRQQWIWTTFEHHDNVPTQKEIDDGSAKRKQYSFYDPKQSDRPVNQTPPWPWDPDALGWVPFQKPSNFKSQIVRTGPSPVFPDDDVGKLNTAFHNWQQIRGTVWENYDLITTQWPSGFPCASLPHPGNLPDATCAPFPAYLANTTLETFSQPQQDTDTQDAEKTVPLATSSCIACHNNATTQHRPATRSDFTYILEKAK